MELYDYQYELNTRRMKSNINAIIDISSDTFGEDSQKGIVEFKRNKCTYKFSYRYFYFIEMESIDNEGTKFTVKVTNDITTFTFILNHKFEESLRYIKRIIDKGEIILFTGQVRGASVMCNSASIREILVTEFLDEGNKMNTNVTVYGLNLSELYQFERPGVIINIEYLFYRLAKLMRRKRKMFLRNI